MRLTAFTDYGLRMLMRMASAPERPFSKALGNLRITPASEVTRLLRTWRGRTHDVLVRVDGVGWRGRRYRSLSAVARAITGTSRNGPAFFGKRGGEDGGRSRTGAARSTPANQPARCSSRSPRPRR